MLAYTLDCNRLNFDVRHFKNTSTVSLLIIDSTRSNNRGEDYKKKRPLLSLKAK